MRKLFTFLFIVFLLSGCSKKQVKSAAENVDEKKAELSAVSEEFKKVVYFDFEKSEIKPKYSNVLKEAESYLKSNPESVVVVSGHTDDRGSKEFNTTLSQKRAVNVKRYLTKKLKISENRIKANWFGESQPVSKNRSLNRRVEITVYQP